MADGFVRVAPDSTGKKLDTSEVTRADGTTVVERERVVISDPSNPLTPDAQVGARGLAVQTDDVLTQLIKIREILTAMHIHQLDKLR
jgi:hypothetical protein